MVSFEIFRGKISQELLILNIFVFEFLMLDLCLTVFVTAYGPGGMHKDP